MKLLEVLLNELWLREIRSVSAEDLQQIMEEASTIGSGEMADEYLKSFGSIAALLVDARIRKLLGQDGEPGEESLDREALLAIKSIRDRLERLYRGLVPVDHEGRVLVRVERVFERGDAVLKRGDYLMMRPGEAILLAAAGFIHVYELPRGSGAPGGQRNS